MVVRTPGPGDRVREELGGTYYVEPIRCPLAGQRQQRRRHCIAPPGIGGEVDDDIAQPCRRRIVTRATTRDAEQAQKHDLMVQRLLTNGYCPTCVDTVLKYAANNLWKD